MAFQFLCPQGHLLEGDPSQMGQQCNCPTCGMTFIIPVVESAGQVQSSGEAQPVEEAAQPSTGDFQFDFGPGGAAQNDPFAPAESAGVGDLPAAVGEVGGAADNPFTSEAGPRMLHIPCPQGHELETPEDMVGQDVLCPFCGEQFQLRFKDSVEYKRERSLEREAHERKVGNMWFNWAIVAAVIVLLGLGLMIALTVGS